MTRIRITHRLEPDMRENEGEREEDTGRTGTMWQKRPASGLEIDEKTLAAGKVQ